MGFDATENIAKLKPTLSSDSTRDSLLSAASKPEITINNKLLAPQNSSQQDGSYHNLGAEMPTIDCATICSVDFPVIGWPAQNPFKLSKTLIRVFDNLKGIESFIPSPTENIISIRYASDAWTESTLAARIVQESRDTLTVP